MKMKMSSSVEPMSNSSNEESFISPLIINIMRIYKGDVSSRFFETISLSV